MLKILKAYSACAKNHAQLVFNVVFAENTSNMSKNLIFSFIAEGTYSDRL